MPPPAKRSRFFSLRWPHARGCGKQCAACRRPGRSIPFPWTRRPTTSSKAVCPSSPRLLPRRRRRLQSSLPPLVPRQQLCRRREGIGPRGPRGPLFLSRPGASPRPYPGQPPVLDRSRGANSDPNPAQRRGPPQHSHHGHPQGWIGSGRPAPGLRPVLRGRKPARAADGQPGGARMATHGPVACRARVRHALQGAATLVPMRGPMRDPGLEVGRPRLDDGKERGISRPGPGPGRSQASVRDLLEAPRMPHSRDRRSTATSPLPIEVLPVHEVESRFGRARRYAGEDPVGAGLTSEAPTSRAANHPIVRKGGRPPRSGPEESSAVRDRPDSTLLSRVRAGA
jgi:hypothetical protein